MSAGTARCAARPICRARRVGLYGWAASGSIWYRHLLRFVGVEPESLTWWVGDIDTPEWSVHETGMPDFVRAPAPGRSLAQMLIDGELDALFSPPRPRDYHPTAGPIVRLFPEFRSVEQKYFRSCGVYPPQHLIVLRRDAWLSDKSIARALTDAFVHNDEGFAATQRSFPYASPWMEAELEDVEALLGPDFHADGLEANRATMELFAEQAHRVGITRRRVAVDEYFAEYSNPRSRPASRPDRFGSGEASRVQSGVGSHAHRQGPVRPHDGRHHGAADHSGTRGQHAGDHRHHDQDRQPRAFPGESSVFDPLNYGPDAYLRYINAQGGVNGRKFETVFADSAATRRRASPRRRS